MRVAPRKDSKCLNTMHEQSLAAYNVGRRPSPGEHPNDYELNAQVANIGHVPLAPNVPEISQ